MSNTDISHPSSTPGSPTWAHELAVKFGSFLAQAREKASLTQASLAGRLEMDPSWVSRVESGKIPIKSTEDVVTYAEAIGVPEDDAVSAWESLFDENFGIGPWPTRTVLPESFRRLGEQRARDRRYEGPSSAPEFAAGIPLDVLAHILEYDETARLAARSWCSSFVARNPGWKAP